jgi:glycosyltransferase involved in cell wall biosynthesis
VLFSKVDDVSEESVLCVANYPPDEGYAWWLMENFWVQLAAIGRLHGLQPILAYPAAGVVPRSIRDAGIETLVQAFPGQGWGGFMAAVRLIRNRRIRVIYFTDRGFSSVLYAAFRLAGVRHIINHDHTPGDRPPIRGLRGFAKGLWRWLRPISCDVQVCVSPLIGKRAIENARIPERRVAVVQNGIEPIRCDGDRAYAHRVLGISEDRPICITVGRANPYKRLDFIIDVARHTVFELGQEQMIFLHCGDGPDMARLRSLVTEGGLEDHFILAGRRSDVKRLLCSADVAIHAAKGEAFSLAVVEYMSAGLALLVPDVPSVCQAVRHEETGFVYPEGNTVAAARLLADLVHHPEKRSRIGAAAADEVRTYYSQAQMNQQFRDLMTGLLGE